MVDAAYAEAVKATFETKPLRTVLMIDDEFPTLRNLHDLANGTVSDTEKVFRQRPLAVELYDAFRSKNMLCDIENVADEVNVERIRKSDLIVLDYHLGPAEGDSQKSIGILRGLALSKHFNTVVIYTNEPDLDKVWLEVIASLGGAWKTLPGELKGDAKTHWERLNDEDKLPLAPLDAVREFARRRDVRSLSQDVRAVFEKELLVLDVPRNACTGIMEALICAEMAKRAGEYEDAPRHFTNGNYIDGKYWIQSKNTFITILKKANGSEEDRTAPNDVLDCLRDALLQWRPNLIQVLVSEIQNILELEALISDDDLLREPVTHAALSYFLLNSLGPIDLANPPELRPPLTALIDRIVEGVRRRLSTDPDLLSLAEQTLLGELKNSGWSHSRWSDVKTRIAALNAFSRTESVKKQDVFFRLNSFLNTEAFRRAHITCGTLIRDRSTGDCFAVASPACDLVPRQPSANQQWMSAVHPVRPVICVKLMPFDRIDAALNAAADGRHVFLEDGDNKKEVFALYENNDPSYEFMFFENAGIVRDVDGRKIFTARRIGPKVVLAPEEMPADAGDGAQTTNAQGGLQGEAPVTVSPAAAEPIVVTADEQGNPSPSAIEEQSAEDREWVGTEFEVIGQLRSANANRVVQHVTQQLSRIGLDFTSMPA